MRKEILTRLARLEARIAEAEEGDDGADDLTPEFRAELERREQLREYMDGIERFEFWLIAETAQKDGLSEEDHRRLGEQFAEAQARLDGGEKPDIFGPPVSEEELVELRDWWQKNEPRIPRHPNLPNCYQLRPDLPWVAMPPDMIHLDLNPPDHPHYRERLNQSVEDLRKWRIRLAREDRKNSTETTP